MRPVQERLAYNRGTPAERGRMLPEYLAALLRYQGHPVVMSGHTDVW
jgi:hypothetical protein